MEREQLIRAMKSVLGTEGVVHEREQLRSYECDGLMNYRVVPDLVVLPETAEHVQQIVRICYEEGIPFVARGSGTGLSGGALPVESGVLIVLSRMRKILEVDIPNQRIVVEPGVVNIWVSQEVADEGYYYAPDPASQVVSSIGGNLAENSGGVHCLKYGFTTNHVMGAEVVLADGSVVHIGGGKAPDAPGYELLGAFVGSEGTLGIATKITLRLLREPEAVRTLLAAFEDTEKAGDAVSGIIGHGIVPAAIEMMDKLCIEAVETAVHPNFPEARAILIVELDGPEAEVADQFDRVIKICEEADATEIRIAEDDAERALFWKGRKAAFAAMGRIANDYYVQDSVVPRTELGNVLKRISELGEEYGMRVANVFHAGDGNLHPLVLYNNENPGEAEKAEELAGEIVFACLDHGGSLTGEHGIGVDKKKYMPKMFTDEDMETMQLLRCAFDPHGLCNPGKVFPTPRLCGERPGPFRMHPVQKAGLAENF
jgi:glycolate oxidase